MSNFKSGSGNLDFGSDDEDDEKDETDAETTEKQAERKKRPESIPTEKPTSTTPDGSSSDKERPSESANEYPYFVRRSNVGDERDTRLEIHVRDKVVDREAEFRSELAKQLETNEIAKTDAREFALLLAFQNPERVAELMQEEGFGTLD